MLLFLSTLYSWISTNALKVIFLYWLYVANVTILHIQPSFLQLAERALTIFLSLPLCCFQHYLTAVIAGMMGFSLPSSQHTFLGKQMLHKHASLP